MALDRVTQELADRIKAAEARIRALETPDAFAPDALDGYLPLAGGTMAGFITLHADPTAAMHAVTMQYVDGLIGRDVVIASGTSVVNWNSNTVAWHNDPNLSVSVNPVVTSTVMAWGYMTWRCDNTRAQACAFRLNLNAVTGWNHGNVGAAGYRFNPITVLGIWTGVTAGAKALIFQLQPANAGDTIATWERHIFAIAIPE